SRGVRQFGWLKAASFTVHRGEAAFEFYRLRNEFEMKSGAPVKGRRFSAFECPFDLEDEG
ncbi:MAG: hypothetical protein ABI693_30805, partial [Bryobacteraceae bacterium]